MLGVDLAVEVHMIKIGASARMSFDPLAADPSRIPVGAPAEWTPVPGSGKSVPHPGKRRSQIPHIAHRVEILEIYAMGGPAFY